MKRILYTAVLCVLIFGLAGTAGAVPFGPVVHDYSGDGTYLGQSYMALSAWAANTSFPDNFLFPSVTPPAGSIESAYVTITHVGNSSGPVNSEVWILTDASAYSIGTLSGSGSPLAGSRWVTDSFALSPDVISGITSNTPWRLALRLTETTSLLDVLWVDRASFGGEYASVPEPSTLMLLGIGLVGVARFSRKKLYK